jgi:3D (Asp-Asp-Asp) domain-containing protein
MYWLLFPAGLSAALFLRGVVGCTPPVSAVQRTPRRVKLTFYYIADTTSGNIPIISRSNKIIDYVSKVSYDSLVMEGSGRLPNGKLVNFSGEKITHPSFGSLWKFSEVSHATGKAGKKLIPFKSIAVDPAVFPLGSTVYITELDQQFSADDTGEAIKGNHIDLFIGDSSNASKGYKLPQEVWAVQV